MHLSSSAFTLAGTLNDTRKVEQLNLGLIVVDDAWNALQGTAGKECTPLKHKRIPSSYEAIQ